MGKGSRRARTARRAEANKHKVRDVFVAQPFEGLAAETELIAMREFVPSATAELTLTADDTPVTLASVLPGAAAAMVRSDGKRFVAMQVQTRSSDVSRDVGRSLRWVLSAEPGAVLAVPDTTSPPEEGERLQDQLDAGAVLTPELHEDFSWWLPEDPASATSEAALSLERANEAILPTERVGPAAYWVDAGEKAHLRWVRPEPENDVLKALARLSARGELGLTEDSRYVGSFRAHGLLVPVWDLDRDAHAREWTEPAKQLGVRLEEALASLSDEPLTGDERRARDGIIGRQLTLR
ncbi:MAG: DUF5926 family protein [Thermocrispum sp.]